MRRTFLLIVMFLFMILLFGILFSYAMFEGGFVSWFLFYSFIPVFLYEMAFFLYPLKRWQMSRHFSHHVAHAGDNVRVTLHMKRFLPFPLYYTIFEEVFPDSMQKVNMQYDTYRYLNNANGLNVIRKLKRAVFPWFKRHLEETYVIEKIPRGRHNFQYLRVRISDIFGFIHKEYIFPVEDEVMVYPTTREIHMLGRMSAFDHGEQSAYSFRLKSSNIAIGTREYVPGDKFSWIDWKQTARKNELMTKEFEQEKSTDTMVVLNACHHNGFNLLAFEAAVEMAYSIVDSIYRDASKADFLSIGKENVHMSLLHDEAQMIGLREHLTKIEPVGTESFAAEAKKEVTQMGSGYVMVIVTTRVDEAFKNAMLQMTIRMKRIIIILIQGSSRIADVAYEQIRQMQSKGIIVNVLTEKELVQRAIGVNVV